MQSSRPVLGHEAKFYGLGLGPMALVINNNEYKQKQAQYFRSFSYYAIGRTVYLNFCAGYTFKGLGFRTYGLGLKGPRSTALLQITKNVFLAHLTKMFP